MNPTECLVAQQVWVGVSFDEEENCYVLEQNDGNDETSSSIYISAWNITAFIERLREFDHARRKAE